ncbi:hypothetical protein Vadar_032456 [Vaccinium darrowii]|uniref:Uncharacterized protein n=1 Tax=Vaccinium darrowii TaxID=229202 RepID=A0ACB7ZPF6_9ERIC|nr:hypothetical protein Vadar_032456 [Vaccinium darrowii]
MYPNKQKQPYLNVFCSICVKNLAFCLQFLKAIVCSDAAAKAARYGFTVVERPEGFLVLAIAFLGKHVTKFNQTPEAEAANKIMKMICWKFTKTGTVSTDSSVLPNSSIGGPSASIGEDAYQIPMLPAWEVLEAIPFVLEALLTACAHGRLSSRDLTTGLRDLVDFRPASLTAIISYFSAEISRGIWKPVSMNGMDWPSPAANLVAIETEIKEILSSVGVNAPRSLSHYVGATIWLCVCLDIHESFRDVPKSHGGGTTSHAYRWYPSGVCCSYTLHPIIGDCGPNKSKAQPQLYSGTFMYSRDGLLSQASMPRPNVEHSDNAPTMNH